MAVNSRLGTLYFLWKTLLIFVGSIFDPAFVILWKFSGDAPFNSFSSGHLSLCLAKKYPIDVDKLSCSFYTIAVISISINKSSLINLLTSTIVATGFISLKNSPCALPACSQLAILVTNILVRTTFFMPAPA